MAEQNSQNGGGFSTNIGVGNPRRDEVCDFLDSFNDLENFSTVKPSTLLKGGGFAMLSENRITNPDWMAQSAHSFREIHYGFTDNRKILFQIKRLFVRTAIKVFKYKAKNIPRNRKDKIFDSL